MELPSEAVDAARSEPVERAERQVTRAIDLPVEGALATERLQVPDQFQEFEFDGAELVRPVDLSVDPLQSRGFAHCSCLASRGQVRMLTTRPRPTTGDHQQGPRGGDDTGCGTGSERRRPPRSSECAVSSPLIPLTR